MCRKCNLKTDLVKVSIDGGERIHPRQPKLLCNIDAIDAVIDEAYSAMREASLSLDDTIQRFFERSIDRDNVLEFILPHCLQLIRAVKKMSSASYRLLCDFWASVEWGKMEALNVDDMSVENKDCKSDYPVRKHHRQNEWKSLQFGRDKWMEYELKILNKISRYEKLSKENTNLTDETIDEIDRHIQSLIELGEELYNRCVGLIIDIESALYWANKEAMYYDTLISESN